MYQIGWGVMMPMNMGVMPRGCCKGWQKWGVHPTRMWVRGVMPAIALWGVPTPILIILVILTF